VELGGGSQAYAADEILEARIVAYGIEERTYFDPLQNGGLLLESLLGTKRTRTRPPGAWLKT
jgi:hypothetical protein